MTEAMTEAMTTVDLAAIEPRTCVVRNTGAHRGRRFSVTPENSAARHLHFGRIVLEDSDAPLNFSTADLETGLLCLADRIGRPSVLFTTDDAGAIFLAAHGRDLRRWFLFPDPPGDLPGRLAGKYSWHEACRELPAAGVALVVRPERDRGERAAVGAFRAQTAHARSFS